MIIFKIILFTPEWKKKIITIKLELKKSRYQQHFNIEPNL